MADARRGNQLEQTVRHADSGPQHGHHRELLAGDHRRLHLDQGRLDGLRGQRQVTGHLVAHQQGDLAQQLPKGPRGRSLVPHVGELVLDQRVVEDEKVGEAGILFHGNAP
jgi:hypothetical protein